MEGVMMRAPHSYYLAVRRPSGELATEQMPVQRPSEKYRILGYPVFRGIGTLAQSLYLGIRALRFSANAALEQEGGEDQKQQEISPWLMGVNLAVSLGFFILLYKLLPLSLTTWLGGRLPLLQGHIAFNLTDGLIRILIFLAFLYGVSRWKDIRRVFEYHGAEHKAVFNFESGRPLSVDNARQFSTLHPRCGTSFLLVVMVIAIGVYALIPFESFLMKFLLRVALLPLIAGLSYEVIRFAATHRGSLLAVMARPGLWLQRITTQPPDDSQLAVALHALEGAMALEHAQGGELVVA